MDKFLDFFKTLVTQDKTMKIVAIAAAVLLVQFLGLAPDKATEIALTVLGLAGAVSLKAGSARIERSVAGVSEALGDILAVEADDEQ